MGPTFNFTSYLGLQSNHKTGKIVLEKLEVSVLAETLTVENIIINSVFFLTIFRHLQANTCRNSEVEENCG